MKECIMGEKCDCQHNVKGCRKPKGKIDTLVCPPVCDLYEQRRPEIDKAVRKKKGAA